MGRIPDSVKHKFEMILESPSGIEKFKRIMARTEKEDSFLKYFQEAMDRRYGKPTEHQEVENVNQGLTKDQLLDLRKDYLDRHSNGVSEGQ